MNKATKPSFLVKAPQKPIEPTMSTPIVIYKPKSKTFKAEQAIKNGADIKEVKRLILNANEDGFYDAVVYNTDDTLEADLNELSSINEIKKFLDDNYEPDIGYNDCYVYIDTVMNIIKNHPEFDNGIDYSRIRIEANTDYYSDEDNHPKVHLTVIYDKVNADYDKNLAAYENALTKYNKEKAEYNKKKKEHTVKLKEYIKEFRKYNEWKEQRVKQLEENGEL